MHVWLIISIEEVDNWKLHALLQQRAIAKQV